MTDGGDGAAAPFDREMFRGSRKLSRGLTLLRALPGPVAVSLLAFGAIGDGIRRGRYARAYRWASALGYGAAGRHWLSIRLLVNHGRFIAQEAMLGGREPGRPVRAVTLTGREHLDSAPGGVLLLGFHLGPPRTWLTLRSLGMPVRMVARFDRAQSDERWAALAKAGEILPLPEHDPAGRVRALYRIRTLLSRKAHIFMTADGPMGREVFRLDLPGMPLIVRAGWFSVRRQARVPTFPVLVHEEAGRTVVAIHPPLPPVIDDEAADMAACRAALTPLVHEFVTRYPAQCRYLVFPRWADEALGQASPMSGQ